MKLFKVSVTKTSAIITVLIGAVVLVGWSLQISNFNNFFPGRVVMKFNTALCFTLTGIALYNLTTQLKYNKKIITCCAFLIILISALTFYEYAFKHDLGIDELLFKETGTSNVYPGRMSVATSFNFLMIGSLLLLIPNKNLHAYLQLIIFIVLIVSIFAICSYAFSLNYFNQFPEVTKVSIYTAITFIIICIGLLYSPYLNYIHFTFERKLIIGLGLILFVIALIFFAFNKNNEDYIDTGIWVEHTKDVLYESEKLFSTTKDIETVARGFVISGDEKLLEPYYTSLKTIFVTANRLKALTKDNLSQQSRIKFINTLIEKRINISNRLIDLRKSNKFNLSTAAVIVAEGKLYTDQIRAAIADIQQDENLLLIKRKTANQNSINNSLRIISFFQLAIIVILTIVVIIIDSNIKIRNLSESALKASNERFFKIFNLNPIATNITGIDDGRILYVNDAYLKLFKRQKEHVIGKMATELNMICPEQREKILKLIKKENGKTHNIDIKLKDGNGEIKDVLCSTETLEVDGKMCYISTMLDITERKKAEEQIMAVNKELESFSYSVSHDLRAPLRAIDGYTKILKEDYGNKLDDEGSRLMRVIINNAKKMGLLIDDLLAFSRLGKQSLIKVTIDMDFLVNSVVTDLKNMQHKEEVEITIGPLLNIQGDNNMIRQVMINLVSNALKYSRNKEKSIIKIASYEENGNIIYYVKDNGAGFDMKYYEKLFGVFQRLHTSEEFEGTGVGLAIVQRIIAKHHGKVYAEGEVNKGATFYFSIPVA